MIRSKLASDFGGFVVSRFETVSLRQVTLSLETQNSISKSYRGRDGLPWGGVDPVLALSSNGVQF